MAYLIITENEEACEGKYVCRISKHAGFNNSALTEKLTPDII